MSAEQSESVARAYFAAVARGDRAALLGFPRSSCGASLKVRSSPTVAHTAYDNDNDYEFVFELRDGRIAEIREHVGTRHSARG
jgi:ketosteroid isomerase-like protein